MADDYRVSKEWQALNRIWKAVPASARESVKDDFRIITEMIKSGQQTVEKKQIDIPAKPAAAPAVQTPAMPQGDTNFLAGLSAGAKKLALGMLTKEGFNLYDFLVELALKTKAADAEELFDAYVSQRDIDDEQEEALMEIINVCIRKAGIGA